MFLTKHRFSHKLLWGDFVFDIIMNSFILILSLVGLTTLINACVRRFLLPPPRVTVVLMLSEQDAETQLRSAIVRYEQAHIIAVCDELCEQTKDVMQCVFTNQNIAFCKLDEIFEILRNV